REPDGTRHRLDQPQEQPAHRGFAATRLTDKRERAAGRQAQVYPVHGLDRRGWPPEYRTADNKMPGQAFDLEPRGAHTTIPSNGAFTHRDQWRAPTSTIGGALLTQISLVKGHRAAKRQPCGTSLMSGSEPSIVASVSTRRSRRGIE